MTLEKFEFPPTEFCWMFLHIFACLKLYCLQFVTSSNNWSIIFNQHCKRGILCSTHHQINHIERFIQFFVISDPADSWLTTKDRLKTLNKADRWGGRAIISKSIPIADGFWHQWLAIPCLCMPIASTYKVV